MIKEDRMRHIKYSDVALLLAIMLSSCGLAGFAAAQQPPIPLSTKPLKGGVYWVEGGAGANTAFIVGTDGVIVIDAKMTADSAKEMLGEIAKVTSQPVTHVILTHSDGDHVNGLAGFPKGLTIIAQENCKKEMEDSLGGPRPSPHDYLPTKTVADKESLTLHGVRIELLHFGPAHTNGDLVVYLPSQKMAFTGDLTQPLPYPIIHPEKNGSSEGWIHTTKMLLAMKVETYVPGHGELQTKADLQKSLKDLEERRTKIKELVAQGKSLDEIKIALGETGTPAPGPRSNFTEVVYKENSKH